MLFSRRHYLERYAGGRPRLRFEEYFNGPVKASGIIQDYSGRVRRRFEIDMAGNWEGRHGTLEEHFRYDDGETEQRIWRVEVTSDGKYKGTAHDIIGEAVGAASGNAIRWAYRMKIGVNGKIWRFTMDDWMFLMDDGMLVNRAYLKKFGFTVGELTVFMQRRNVSA